MTRVIDRSKHGHEAGREILRIRQGNRTVSDYAIAFQTLATTSGWEPRALYDAFLHGLSESIKDELLTRELPEDINSLISLAIKVDARLEESRRFAAPRPFSFTVPPSAPPRPAIPVARLGTVEEPMQVNRTGVRVTSQGQCLLLLRQAGALCLTVSVKRKWPLVSRGALVGTIPVKNSSRARTCLPVSLDWGGGSRKTSALLDSGAEDNFLDTALRLVGEFPLWPLSAHLSLVQ